MKQAARQADVEVKGFYLTLGQYDFVFLMDATDDETMARLMLATSAQGNFRTETLRAFTEDEYRRIIGALP